LLQKHSLWAALPHLVDAVGHDLRCGTVLQFGLAVQIALGILR
jgi:hypothetical protein